MNFMNLIFNELLVVTSGLAHIADQLAAKAQIAMSHMAIGTGTTAEVAGDTTLGTEIARVAFDSKTSAAAKVSYVTTFPAGTGTGAITEVGILNAAAAGDLLTRIVFPVKNKGVSDSLVITIEHIYAAA